MISTTREESDLSGDKENSPPANETFTEASPITSALAAETDTVVEPSVEEKPVVIKNEAVEMKDEEKPLSVSEAANSNTNNALVIKNEREGNCYW